MRTASLAGKLSACGQHAVQRRVVDGGEAADGGTIRGEDVLNGLEVARVESDGAQEGRVVREARHLTEREALLEVGLRELRHLRKCSAQIEK